MIQYISIRVKAIGSTFNRYEEEIKDMMVQELEKFIERYGKDIYSFCKKLCVDADLADELYQDVWLKAMQNIDEIDTNQNVKSYLISIAIGIWRNKKKKFAVRNRIAPRAENDVEIEQVLDDKRKSVLEDIMKEERKKVVLKAVNGLTDTYRVPVLLYYMEDQTVKEIAKELRIPEGTVKRRLWTARNKLSKELEEYING